MRESVLEGGFKRVREKPKSSLKKKIVRSILALAAFGGGAYGLNEAYQNNLLPIRPVPPTFDNTINKGAIGNKNTIRINENTLATIGTLPAVQTPKNDIYLLMPVQNLPSNVDIPYDKAFSGEEVNLKITPSLTKLQYAKEQGTKDRMVLMNIPENTPILAPVDGLLEFSIIRTNVAPPGTIEGISLFYKSSEGTVYQVAMGGGGNFFKPLVEATPYVFGQTENTERSRSALRVEVKRGQPIAQTLKSTNLSIFTQAWPSGQIGIEGTGIYPTNINLISFPNNLGQNKVAIIGK